MSNLFIPEPGEICGIRLENDRSYMTDVFRCIAKDAHRIVLEKIVGWSFSDNHYVFHLQDKWKVHFEHISDEVLLALNFKQEPKMTLSENVTVSPEFRAEMNQWMLDRFGTKIVPPPQ